MSKTKTWNLIGNFRPPVTEYDVRRLEEYMKLVEAKGKVETAIKKYNIAYEMISFENNKAIDQMLNIRRLRRVAFVQLQEINNEIDSFGF